MELPTNLLYSKSHEWVCKKNDGTATVGLTDYAQDQLGDIVYVNLPELETIVTVEETFADVESVKAVSDIYSPVTGVVCAVNDELAEHPELINSAPYDSWIAEISDITAFGELLSSDEYAAFCQEQ